MKALVNLLRRAFTKPPVLHPPVKPLERPHMLCRHVLQATEGPSVPKPFTFAG